ncbi:MAG TPA: hypothetical protein VFE02_11770 [Candidatus Acidoferrales bacterium]|jgi:hypothetical protein|nr:hypothetical protein [Candidatus Acidoferrales bacterium]
MPSRQRKPSELTQQTIPLLLLGIGLITTNNASVFLSDEATMLGDAARPLSSIANGFFSGAATREHAPLFQILLHFWLKGVQGNFDFLRVPSILFFIAGLFFLARSTRYFTGARGGYAVIWLGVLWPFGFHFARLASWYSFSFFLVAGITLSYFKYLESQTLGRWVPLFLFSAALLWTNPFGWAVLACLALDQVIRWRRKEPAGSAKGLIGTAALLIVIFVPFISPLRAELSHGILSRANPLSLLASLGFHAFSLFVSESIAPWFWWQSVPAALAILFSLTVTAWWIPAAARRLLLYSGLLLIVMAVLGTLQTKYLLMISPWVLLAAGIAIETEKPRWATFGFAGALLLVGAMGWYGIYAKRFYSAPQFIEPWQEIAANSANQISAGATIIADHPSFLFYLTYYLHLPPQTGPWRFEGLLPDAVTHPQVFSSQGWLDSGHPTHGKMVVVRAGRDAGGNEPIDRAVTLLDQSCGSISSRLRARDSGYLWKQRFLPEAGDPLWRIEIREYDCNQTNSKQIYPLPAQ